MFNPDFVLRIETGNSAFEPDPSPEVARILRELAKSIETNGLDVGTRVRLMDVNGNTVGHATLEE